MRDRPEAGRRRVLKVLTGSAGASLALPAVAAQHEAPPHAAGPATAEPPAAAAGPAFLDAHQLETVASLAEAIVPGSAAAAVAPFVDRLLAVDTQENQRDFLAALGAIQAESASRYHRPWLALAGARRRSS